MNHSDVDKLAFIQDQTQAYILAYKNIEVKIHRCLFTPAIHLKHQVGATTIKTIQGRCKHWLRIPDFKKQLKFGQGMNELKKHQTEICLLPAKSLAIPLSPY